MNTDTSERSIELKERPNPQRAYRIVMTIENAPGLFAMIEGSAQYDVANEDECGKFNRMAGGYDRMTTSPQIRWEKRSDTEYVATVYADLMMDEDYYGRGVCHWVLTEARARIKATGAEVETRFVPAISAEEIVVGEAVTWYFWKGGYPVDTPLPSNGKGFPDLGQKDIDNVPVEKRNEFFAVTLVPKEVQP